ncbi:hypothetical protein ACHAWF_006183 [Thalassiosira exigua]
MKEAREREGGEGGGTEEVGHADHAAERHVVVQDGSARRAKVVKMAGVPRLNRIHKNGGGTGGDFSPEGKRRALLVGGAGDETLPRHVPRTTGTEGVTDGIAAGATRALDDERERDDGRRDGAGHGRSRSRSRSRSRERRKKERRRSDGIRSRSSSRRRGKQKRRQPRRDVSRSRSRSRSDSRERRRKKEAVQAGKESQRSWSRSRSDDRERSHQGGRGNGGNGRKTGKRRRDAGERVGNCPPRWLVPHIRVRLVSERRHRKHPLKKGVVQDVLEGPDCPTAVLLMDDDGAVLDGIPERRLETAVPRAGVGSRSWTTEARTAGVDGSGGGCWNGRRRGADTGSSSSTWTWRSRGSHWTG